MTSEYGKNLTTDEIKTQINKNKTETSDIRFFQKEKAKADLDKKPSKIKQKLDSSEGHKTSLLTRNLQTLENQELNQSSEKREDCSCCPTDNKLLFLVGTTTTTTTTTNKADTKPCKFMNNKRMLTEIYPTSLENKIQHLKSSKKELFLQAFSPIEEEKDSAVFDRDNKLDLHKMGFENLCTESNFLQTLGKHCFLFKNNFIVNFIGASAPLKEGHTTCNI